MGDPRQHPGDVKKMKSDGHASHLSVDVLFDMSEVSSLDGRYLNNVWP
jgi:hypothetical protein